MVHQLQFLINNLNFTRVDATENALSWWSYFSDNDEKIKGFRINKNGNPSIQTHIKLIEVSDDKFEDLDNIEKLCRGL